MRKVLVVMLCLIMAVGIMAACGQKDSAATDEPTKAQAVENESKDEADTAPEKVEVSFRVWDNTQFKVYESIFENFNSESELATVKMEVLGWEQYWEKLQTEMASASAPDIFWNQLIYYPIFLKNGAMEDLKPYIEASDIDMQAYNPTLVKLFAYEDAIYTIPKDWDTIGVFYNKDLFDTANVPYPDGSWEWNTTDGGTFLKTLQQLTLDRNGKNAVEADFDSSDIAQYGYVVYNENQTCYWNFWLGNGGGCQVEAWKDEYLYSSPGTVGANQFLQDLILKYHISPDVTTSSNLGAEDLFYSGQVAMITNGSWALKDIYDNTDFEWGVAMLPKGPEGRISLYNGIGEAMYAQSKNKEAAWEVIEYCYGTSVQSVFAQQGVTFPSIQELIPSFVQTWQDERGIDVSAFIDQVAEGIALSAESQYWNQIGDLETTYMHLLLSGELTPEAFGQTMDEEIANIVK